MRAAYICVDPGVPVFGSKGCSIHVQEMIRAFTELNIHVSLYATRFDGSPSTFASPAFTQQLPVSKSKHCEEREASALALNTFVPDLLDSKGPFDWLYERYSLWSYGALEWANKRGVPAILEVNAPLVEEQGLYRGLVLKKEAEQATRRAFEAATGIVVVSRDLVKYVLQYSKDSGKIHVIPNGVNPSRFPTVIRPALPATGIFTIGFLGSLKPWHGLETLVEAFHQLSQSDRNVRLLIVGDGPQRHALTADLTDRGLLNAAHFTGAVPAANVAGLLASMDVGVAPYREQENVYFSPLKIFEYMAAGLPIVASRAGQLNEIIQHDVNALLCPPGNAFALAQAIDRLRQSFDLRKRLGNAARLKALRDHTWKSIAERILNIAMTQHALS